MIRLTIMEFRRSNHAPVTRCSLLIRLRDANDQRAWEQFVEIYTPLIYGFCRQRGLQDADSADVAQEVMRAVARAIGNFDYQPDRGRFRSWLYAITRSKFNDFLERRRKEPAAGDATMKSLLETQRCPEQDARWDREYNHCVFDWACAQVRGEFTESTWQAFWRSTVNEETGEEVARALGLSVGAVYIAKSRVRTRLRECITEVADNGEVPY